jgi:signal transduction histidine kinase
VKAPFKWNRHSRQLVIQAYLIFILIFTFLFFAFSVVSFYREREKAGRSNLESRARKAIWDVENDIRDHAADCLNSTDLKEFLERKQFDSLDNLRLLRERFQHLKKIYPVAQYFVVFTGSKIIFPRLESPPVQTADSLLASIPGKDRVRFSYLLEQGEKQLRLGNADAAALAYNRAETMEVNARMKAFAVFRRAKAFQKLNDTAASARTYNYLLDSFGDQYDPSQTPYALSLTVGKNNVSHLISPSRRLLDRAYRDLVNGRWEVSSEQAEICLAALEKRLGLSSADRPVSDFLKNFELARAVSAELQSVGSGKITDITARFFNYRNQPYQVFLAPVTGPASPGFTAGFSVSLPWVRNSLLSLIGDRSPAGKTRTISLVEQSQLMDADEVYIPFSTIFPSLIVRLAGKGMPLTEQNPGSDLLFIAVSTCMFFSILAVGLYLLIRVSWDIRWLHLRSDFLSGVSHEFKTPLSLIQLYSETLENDDQAFSSEERKSYIRIIIRESERMSRLIENVLSFSRMEQSQGHGQGAQLQAGDLTDIVKQTVDEYSEYMNLQGFKLVCSLQSKLPPVHFNREQVSQIILNLLENATKYSGSSKRICLSALAQNGEVVIEVQDFGLGIPPGEQEKIFQPFYRVQQRSEKGGCGLGLYLADQVMREHGGRIELESEIDKGSIFRLVFPVSGVRYNRNAQRKRRSRMNA